MLGLVSRKLNLDLAYFSYNSSPLPLKRIILPALRNQLQKLRISCLLDDSLNAHRYSISESCLLERACAISPLRRHLINRWLGSSLLKLLHL